MKSDDIIHGRRRPMPTPTPVSISTDPSVPEAVISSPQSVAEWKLCKIGDTIELFGFTVILTEENYKPFMKDIMWYVNWWLGDRLGDWILPNDNPGKLTKLLNFNTNLYIATGIYATLRKFSVKEEKVGFIQKMKMMFGGVPLS